MSNVNVNLVNNFVIDYMADEWAHEKTIYFSTHLPMSHLTYLVLNISFVLSVIFISGFVLVGGLIFLLDWGLTSL